MNILLSELNAICRGEWIQFAKDESIQVILTDSRFPQIGSGVLFFAINGINHNGHDFIKDLFKMGVNNFIIDTPINIELFPNATILKVENTLHALQSIAEYHRNKFNFPIIGITGSNGKTIVKEWIDQLLTSSIKIVKSPKSYNSQLGVPLSVLQIQSEHKLGVFEAGISVVDEMQRLEKIIKPTIGIFTNIGTAHSEGFASIYEKINEKLKLFTHSKVLIYCKDHNIIHNQVTERLPQLKTFTWSQNPLNNPTLLVNFSKTSSETYIEVTKDSKCDIFCVPFTDISSLENCMHCISLLIYMSYTGVEINSFLKSLKRVSMRLELKEGINDCYLIDDSYNNDWAGTKIALDFLNQQNQYTSKSIILSDIQENRNVDSIYTDLTNLLKHYSWKRLIIIGVKAIQFKNLFPENTIFYPSTDDFIQNFNLAGLHKEIILVKGGRSFKFERIVNKIQKKFHGTVLEINLDALVHNLNFYRNKLDSKTKIMVMVKAFAYGSGSFEVANLLQYHRVDYLGVAYTDEGVALRKAGIRIPIMVMNPNFESFDLLNEYDLEPEIYSTNMLLLYSNHLKTRYLKGKIHIAIYTGMHRLGVEPTDFSEFLAILSQCDFIEPISIFSHLVGADEEHHSDFSSFQINQFSAILNTIKIKYPFILGHISNSAGIVRFPEAQFDMVRLGIGLYGIEATSSFQKNLRVVGTLKTIISQIKHIKKGESVGYARKWIAKEDSTIATIAIGYGDGYNRRFSNGVGKVLLNGKFAYIVGNVCMDMCMINITDIVANEGDEVILWGEKIDIINCAESIDTIPYELLTSVGERVKRVFYTE